MKILNKSKSNYQADCECGALLEYTKEDVKTGSYGCAYIICPKCKREIYDLENKFGKTLTADNVEFPNDYADMKNGVNIDDEKINNWVREGLAKLEEDHQNEYEGVYASGSGNTYVFIFKSDDEYTVYVTKNCFETSIPRY